MKNTPNLQINQKLPAFTLVELLVVLSIIAVLMGLLFPVLGAVMKSAKKTETKVNLQNVVAAIQGYYTEYGRYPKITDAAEDERILTESDQGALIAVLRADQDPESPYVDIVSELNPRLITFLDVKENHVREDEEPKQRDGLDMSKGSKRAYWDVWGNLYQFAYDTNYDEVLGNKPPGLPYASADYLRDRVVGWSPGENQEIEDPGEGRSDDVITW